MIDISSTVKIRTKVPARSIALPIEHGAWGFLLEPALVGAIVAPTLAAPFILLFFAGAFLARQPLKFLVRDWLDGRRLPRTFIALKFAGIYAAMAGVGLVGMLWLMPPASFVPLVAVAPLAAYLISRDISRKPRTLFTELAASLALASSVTVFALAAGWHYVPAYALWAIMLGRLIPSVLYVRSRVRLEKDKEFSRALPIATHILAFSIIASFYFLGLSSILTVSMAAFLTARAWYGLSSYRQVLKANVIGVRELLYGLLYVLSIVIVSF